MRKIESIHGNESNSDSTRRYVDAIEPRGRIGIVVVIASCVQAGEYSFILTMKSISTSINV